MIYEIDEFGFRIEVFPDGAGQILSGIDAGQGDDDIEFKAAVDAMESLALAHACAGIDISEPKYVEGLRTALEACDHSM